MSDLKYYAFVEPHATGGVAKVVVDEAALVRYMREVTPDRGEGRTDADLVYEFCAVHWADEVPASEVVEAMNHGEGRAMLKVTSMQRSTEHAMQTTMRLRNAIQVEIDLAQKNPVRTHWEGCENEHPWCALVKRLREALE